MPHPLRTVPAVAAAVVAVCVAVALATAGPDAARAASGDAERVTYYVVQPGPEGEQEYLFQIAQRLLGDGNRYEEIFALNEGRTQPDGNVLTDPASVLPGWVLVLPDDARGEGVQVGVLPQGSTGADAEAQGSTASDPAAVPYYVIGRTPEGETEYLYLVAERFLGDGERHPEIFALNEGRTQPDGGVLTDPEVVEVGWVLQLPADAAGEGLRYGPLPGPGPTAGVSAPPSATAEDPAAAAEGTAGVPAPWATAALVGAGAVLLAAAVAGVLLLVRRRRAGRAEPFDDSLLRTDTSAAWMVDRALRVLLAACERDGLELPVVTGVFVEGATMRLRLGSPASPAPAPWGANEDGQSWSAPLARLQSAPASEGSTAPFARLVTIGVGETGRVLVDFAAARGVISLDGPTRARHEVLRRWLGS
nr:hypothetical protein GCM10025730_50780 [Promicromonospora thailandica]